LGELIRQWRDMYAEMGGLAWTRNSWLWVFTYRWCNDPANLDEQVRIAQAYPYPQSAEMFTRQCEAVLAFDALDRLGGITTPAHIVAGAEDLLTPLRFSEELAAAIPGAQLTVLPDVGHGMFWEATDQFNAVLLHFLDAHRSRR
jgi:pimeloyl-ACP methyl ester carboxylesterase